MRTDAPKFDPDYPPRLKDVPFSAIFDNPEIAEATTDYDCLLAVDGWGRLEASGGRPMLIAGDSPMYLGIITGSGHTILNPDPRPLVNVHTPCVVKARVKEGRVWKLLGPPIRESSNLHYEETFSFETEIQTLNSFESEVSASITASASVKGLVSEASMTASLSTSLKSSISEMTRSTSSKEIKFSKDRQAGSAYANWAIYRRYEITYGDDVVSDWNPFTKEQFAAIKPGVETYYVFLATFEDDAVMG
jgi:hypothetical protein